MSADANIKTIMGVYEAFGRGDVAAIVEAVTDDVDWAAEAAGTAAPWSGTHPLNQLDVFVHSQTMQKLSIGTADIKDPTLSRCRRDAYRIHGLPWAFKPLPLFFRQCAAGFVRLGATKAPGKRSRNA